MKRCVLLDLSRQSRLIVALLLSRKGLNDALLVTAACWRKDGDESVLVSVYGTVDLLIRTCK